MADVFHLKMSEFLSLLFSENTHTRTDINFLKMADLFHLKMSDFLILPFSENAHTRTDMNVIKMTDFSSAFSLQNTHTRTDINFTQWMISFFISKCPTWFFSSNTHTRTDFDVINMVDFSFVLKKMAHMLRYKLYKMADFFHSKLSEFLSLLFSENMHTRTDMNLTKWLICYISKCLNFYLCFFLKIRTYAQISMS